MHLGEVWEHQKISVPLGRRSGNNQTSAWAQSLALGVLDRWAEGLAPVALQGVSAAGGGVMLDGAASASYEAVVAATRAVAAQCVIRPRAP